MQPVIKIPNRLLPHLPVPEDQLRNGCQEVKILGTIEVEPALPDIPLILRLVKRDQHPNSLPTLSSGWSLFRTRIECTVPKPNPMGRNLYILAGTLLLFCIVCLGLSFSNIAQQPGSPGDLALWRTMSIGFFLLSLVIALAATLSSLFEQAERRAEEARQQRRRKL
jgi:hypothetical protein